MPSRERRSEQQPPWEADQSIGVFKLGSADYTLHLQLSGSQERHFGREELLPGSATNGERQYILGRPYIHEPDYHLSVDVFPRPDAAGAIGRVWGVNWSGLRRRDIGQAQAWVYSAQRVAVLWECFLNDGLYTNKPGTDQNLGLLWRGFEQAVLQHAPEAERIITPSWEDIYELSDWHQFLEQHGYQRSTDRSFAKEVAPR